MTGTEGSRKARDTLSHHLLLPRFHCSLHLPLSLSLSLTLPPFHSTSAHSLFRFSPPIMFALISSFNFLSLSLSRRLPYSFSSSVSCLPSFSLYHSEGRMTITQGRRQGSKRKSKRSGERIGEGQKEKESHMERKTETKRESKRER